MFMYCGGFYSHLLYVVVAMFKTGITSVMVKSQFLPGKAHFADCAFIGFLSCVRSNVAGQLACSLNNLGAYRALLEGL